MEIKFVKILSVRAHIRFIGGSRRTRLCLFGEVLVL
jgi:hypothetical protein